MGTTIGILVTSILVASFCLLLLVVVLLAGRVGRGVGILFAGLGVGLGLGLVLEGFSLAKIKFMADSRLDVDLNDGYLPLRSSGDRVYAWKMESELSPFWMLLSEIPALYGS